MFCCGTSDSSGWKFDDASGAEKRASSWTLQRGLFIEDEDEEEKASGRDGDGDAREWWSSVPPGDRVGVVWGLAERGLAERGLAERGLPAGLTAGLPSGLRAGGVRAPAPAPFLPGDQDDASMFSRVPVVTPVPTPASAPSPAPPPIPPTIPPTIPIPIPPILLLLLNGPSSS
jgi:hypothetical protein